MSDLLQKAMYAKRAAGALAKKTPVAAATGEVVQVPAGQVLTLDSAEVTALTHDSAANFDDSYIKKMALQAVNEWATTDDLEDGETIADRLIGLIVGIADEDIDGEIGEDEAAITDTALDSIYDYMLTLGVDEADVDALLNDWDAEVAERVRQIVASNLPDGEDAEDDVLDKLIFTPEDQEATFDDATLDAAYRKVVAVRKGKRVRIRKRIAGKVRLSPAQKLALRKARRRAFTGKAMARRRKSMRLRKSMGM